MSIITKTHSTCMLTVNLKFVIFNFTKWTILLSQYASDCTNAVCCRLVNHSLLQIGIKLKWWLWLLNDYYAIFLHHNNLSTLVVVSLNPASTPADENHHRHHRLVWKSVCLNDASYPEPGVPRLLWERNLLLPSSPDCRAQRFWGGVATLYCGMLKMKWFHVTRGFVWSFNEKSSAPARSQGKGFVAGV